MHVLLVIIGGAVLLGVFALFGRLWGGDMAGVALATKLFVPVWLAVSAIHRNPIRGRSTTAEEAHYLASGGFQG